MIAASIPFSIIRLRPPSVQAIGPLDPRLRQIAAAATGVQLDEIALDAGTNETITLPPTFSPFDSDEIAVLSNALLTAANESEVVLLDLLVEESATPRFGSVELLVRNAAEYLADVWPAGAQLIVLVTRVPDEEDDLGLLLLLPNLGQNIAFVDERENLLDSLGSSQLGVVAQRAALQESELRAAAESRSLRRRGVFRVSTSSREEYAAHKYSADQDDLADLLTRYGRQHEVAAFLHDARGADWLAGAVDAAAIALRPRRVASYSTDDLNPSIGLVGDVRDTHALLLQELLDPEARICLVVPMVKHGSRIRELTHRVAALGGQPPRVLSVFADYNGRPTVDLGLTKTADSEKAPDNRGEFEAFFDATLRRVGASDWRVRAALLLGEDVNDQRRWTRPSVVGLWSLLDEYEAQSRYLDPDHGVLKRMRLDDLDAFWLAEGVLRTIDAELHCDMSEVLILAPNDPTSVQSVARALRDRHRVTLELVPRDLIDVEEPVVPADLVETMRRYAHGKIVLFDESTIAFRTFEGLRRVMWAADREPDLTVSILDLPIQTRVPPETHRSFYSWRPLERGV